MIEVDSSFADYFRDLESIASSSKLDTNEVILWIENESWWTLKIDINSDTPISKLSLEWSNYSFDETIDKEALSNIMTNSERELWYIDDGLKALNGFWVSFDSLLSETRDSWWKANFKDNLKNIVGRFWKEIFTSLSKSYENLWIESSSQILESDISSLSDISSVSDLKSKVENIKSKLDQIKSQISSVQKEIISNHKSEVKNLVERDSKEQEKQLKILDFMKVSGFNLIPKELTDRLISDMKSNILTIPWLDLNPKNIDLKNWNFGETDMFANSDEWMSRMAKINMVSFINKMISWDTDQPLNANAIANWNMVVSPTFLKNKFIEADIMSSMWWKLNKIRGNLKNSANGGSVI
jgi:hypothetical protein